MGARDACAWLLLGSLPLLLLPSASAIDSLTRIQYEQFATAGERRLQCPYPFLAIRDQCFYVCDRILVTPFSEARKYCQGLGGDLARPAQPYVLLSYLAEQDTGERSSRRLFWLGAQRANSVEPFLWVKGGDSEGLSDENLWHHSDSLSLPDDRPDDHCLYVGPFHTSQLWHNYPCNYSLRFVCQYFKRDECS